jgi:hypothetical protein
MRLKPRSSYVGAFFWLLASLRLRYDIAKASVCLFSRVCKHRQFSDFRSDSPLTFSSFRFRFGDIGDGLCVCSLLAPQSSASPASRGALHSCVSATRRSTWLSWPSPLCDLGMEVLCESVTIAYPFHSSIGHFGMAVCAVVSTNVPSGHAGDPVLTSPVGSGSVLGRC